MTDDWLAPVMVPFNTPEIVIGVWLGFTGWPLTESAVKLIENGVFT